MGSVHGGTFDAEINVTLNATLVATDFAGRLLQLDRWLFLANLFGSSGTSCAAAALHVGRLAIACRRMGTLLVP